MAFSRRLGVIGIVGASWLVAVGCGSDDDKKTNTEAGAGEAGDSGGGKSSVGGSSNNAGKGGTNTAGKGGTGGVGGKNAGGTAGSGGTTSVAGAADGGAAGSTELPAGGTDGGGAGNAGADAGGAGGAGGSPAAVALACDYQCINDSDCEIPGPITDTSHKCNQVTKRCEDPRSVCDSDDDCVAFVSDWVTECDDDSGCFADLEACVASNGKGYCASVPDESFPEFPCLSGVVLTVTRFGAQGEVQVCGSPDARCFDGTCAAGCQDPDKGSCDAGEGDTCNNTTGRCECADGTECASGVCENSHCVQCATSDDCTASAAFTGLDTCVNGKCSCSGSQACPDGGFESASAVCE